MMNVGVIDVGSHTVRLLLASRDDGRIQPLRQEKAAIGLGAEVESLGRLSEEKIAEAASLVGSFARIARKAGAVHVETRGDRTGASETRTARTSSARFTKHRAHLYGC